MPTIIIFLFFIFNLALRLPALLNQELPPFQFCDESIYSQEAFRLLMEKSFFTHEFRAGGFNIYIPLLFGKLYSFFTGKAPDFISFLLITRILLAGVLNSLSVFILAKIGDIIFKDNVPKILLLLSFTISPMIVGVNRMWYPDHYIFFFSSLYLLFLLQLNESKTVANLHQKIGTSLALIISIKYTGILMVVPLAVSYYIYIKNQINSHGLNKPQLKKNITLFFKLFISFSLTILLFQFSAIKNFNEFISGFLFNINNYTKNSPGFNIYGVLFYFVIVFVSSLGFSCFFCYGIGFYKLYKKNKNIFFVLISFPIFTIIYLGKANLVINRNMMIVMPFVLPVLAEGLSYFFLKLTTRIKTSNIFILSLTIIFFFSEPAYKLYSQFVMDLNPDSRAAAREWVLENIPNGSKIMHNEFCSGESPAPTEKYKLIEDNVLDFNNFDFYIYNSWWNSSIKKYFPSKSMLFEKYYSQLHYLHFNEKNIFPHLAPPRKIEDLLNDKNLIIIKEFNSSGPQIIILKKQ